MHHERAAMAKTFVEKYVEDPLRKRAFLQERAIYEVTALLESAMAESGVSRADLAKRLGRSRGWVTQLLDGEANKTIRTIADTFAVLEWEYHSSYGPIQIGRNTTSSVSCELPTKSATTGDLHESTEKTIKLYDPNNMLFSQNKWYEIRNSSKTVEANLSRMAK
jgi:hypothetical protein